MKRYMKNLVSTAAIGLVFGIVSCTGDLDVTPISPNIDTELNADGLFNKCYANFALAGNGGANGDCWMAERRDLCANCSTQTS